MLTSLWSDIRYSARTLIRNPGFAAAAILTVGLGVGVNTGIFSVLNGLLFRDLPAVDADELVAISLSQTDPFGSEDQSTIRQRPFSTSQYRLLRDQAQTLSGLLAHSDPTRTTLGGESPQQLVGTIVTCNYFDVLGQPVALGRGLTIQDCETSSPPVVVLSDTLWTSAFGEDRTIVGRTIELNRQPFTVVGVAAAGTYSGLDVYGTDYFAPISTEPLLLPGENSYGDDNAHWLGLIGRRTVGLNQVRAEFGSLETQLDQLEPGRSTTIDIARATPLQLNFLRVVAFAVGGVVMTAFGLVLLIACANVANLLLARATARGREVVVRISLGASRVRVIRQLLSESLIISAAGGVLGSVLALSSFPRVIASALRSISPPGVPSVIVDASPDVRVLWFTLAVTLLTGVLFGLTPALQISKPDLHSVIKQNAPGAGSRRGGRLQGTLVGVQVAICMVLVIATGLLLRGLGASQSIDPGFDYSDVVVASYDLEGSGYGADEALAFQRRMLEDVRSLPEVEAAAYGVTVPLSADNESLRIRLPGQDSTRELRLNYVTPGFFDVIGLPIVRGRAFDGQDFQESSNEIVVTESTAQNLWPGLDAIGQSLTMTAGFGAEFTATVIGIARDAQVTVLGQNEPYFAYLPAGPGAATLSNLLVKGRGDTALTAASIRNALQSLDSGVVAQVVPLEANLDYWRGISSMVTMLAGTLGVLALALASVGIFGVVAYFVGRRTREIGIRMALGARHKDVLAMIIRRTMRPVLIGAAAGIAAAAGVSGVLSSVLFGISALDPIAVAGAAFCVLGVALAAVLIPGRRAARTEPTSALRYE